MDGQIKNDVRVAVGTVDIATGELLIIKRSLCLIAFSNYKYTNTGLFINTALFAHTFVINRNEMLHANCGLIIHPAA